MKFLKYIVKNFPVDTRDTFVLGGLAMTFYGLYDFKPWVAYAIVGTAVVAIGLFFGLFVKRGDPE